MCEHFEKLESNSLRNIQHQSAMKQGESVKDFALPFNVKCCHLTLIFPYFA